MLGLRAQGAYLNDCEGFISLIKELVDGIYDKVRKELGVRYIFYELPGPPFYYLYYHI